MISGYVGVACAKCGNTSDSLGVMVDSTGALVCFWCKAPDSPAAPALVTECPEHGGAYDCTPFCEICEGNQEY